MDRRAPRKKAHPHGKERDGASNLSAEAVECGTMCDPSPDPRYSEG